MFTTWLFEQRDRDDETGKFANLAYSDYNAGCASLFTDAVKWKNHFSEKHPKSYDTLFEMLADAYVEFCTEVGK